MRPTALATAITGAGLLAVGLAGCTAADASPGSSSAAAAPSASTASSGASAAFKDGTYTELGRYTSPGGPSAVDVTLTLQSGVVKAVKVVPKAENPTAAGYESQFASGVGSKVVGKRLTELDVTVVSGSSLTSRGFDAAVQAIQAKAKA